VATVAMEVARLRSSHCALASMLPLVTGERRFGTTIFLRAHSPLADLTPLLALAGVALALQDIAPHESAHNRPHLNAEGTKT